MGYSIRGTLFYTIHGAIRRTVKEIKGTVEQSPTYYSFMYGWDQRIKQEVFEALDKAEQREYFQNLVLAKRIPLAKPLKAGDYVALEKKAKLTSEGSRREKYIFYNYEQSSEKEYVSYREAAQKYFQEKFKDYFKDLTDPQALEKAVKKIITAVIEALEKKTIKNSVCRTVHGALLKMLQGGVDPYDIFGAVVIVAESFGDIRSDIETTDNKTRPAPNIYLASKEKIQTIYDIATTNSTEEVKRLVAINYAGTSLLTGALIGNSYTGKTAEFFNHLIAKDSIQIIFVLTEPESAAAEDACRYKMRPRQLKKR